AQLCQPWLESRSRSEFVPGIVSKFPREEKNISAPTRLVSPWLPAAGRSEVWTVAMTESVVRSTTETLRETKFATYATVPALLIPIRCGFLPGLLKLV